MTSSCFTEHSGTVDSPTVLVFDDEDDDVIGYIQNYKS